MQDFSKLAALKCRSLQQAIVLQQITSKSTPILYQITRKTGSVFMDDLKKSEIVILDPIKYAIHDGLHEVKVSTKIVML